METAIERLTLIRAKKKEIEDIMKPLETKFKHGDVLTDAELANYLNYSRELSELTDQEKAIVDSLVLKPSKINEKKHPTCGIEVPKTRGLFAGLGIVGLTTILLLLNAFTAFGQNFSVFGQSWGPIFTGSTSHMLNGILSAITESALWVGGATALGVGGEAIRNLVQYRNYKFSSIKKLNDNDVTDILFKKILVTTGDEKSIFDQLKAVREEYAKTKNWFKKMELYRQMTVLNKFINKSMERLGDRLNQLSKETRACSRFEDPRIVEKFREIEKIQKLFMAVLDKEDGVDAHFKTFKKILKKYRTSIDIGSAFTSNEETVPSFEEQEIINALKFNDIDLAIKCFCTQAQQFTLEDILKDYPIYTLRRTVDTTLGILTLEDIARESTRDSVRYAELTKTLEALARHSYSETRNTEEKVKIIEIKAQGSLDRINLYERTAKELTEKGMLALEQQKLFVELLIDVAQALDDDSTNEGIEAAKCDLINTLGAKGFSSKLISVAPALVDKIAENIKLVEESKRGHRIIKGLAQSAKEAEDSAKASADSANESADKAKESAASAKESADKAKNAEDSAIESAKEANNILGQIEKIAKKCRNKVDNILKRYEETLKKLEKLESDVSAGYWLYTEAASENNQKLKQMIEIYSQSVISYEKAAETYLALIHEAETREELEKAVKLLQEETDSIKAEIETINETITETQSYATEILLSLLRERKINRQSISNIQNIVNVYIKENGNDIKKIQEVIYWLQNDLNKSNLSQKELSEQIESIITNILSGKKIIATKTNEEKEAARLVKEERDARLDTLRVYIAIIHENKGKSVCPTSEDELERSTKVSITDTADKFARKGVKFTADSSLVKSLYNFLKVYASKEIADKFAKRSLEYTSKISVEEVNECIRHIEDACKKYNTEFETAPKPGN